MPVAYLPNAFLDPEPGGNICRLPTHLGASDRRRKQLRRVEPSVGIECAPHTLHCIEVFSVKEQSDVGFFLQPDAMLPGDAAAGGHGVLVYHYGKNNALAMWGSSPAFGMDANTMLAWHKYGGGKELLARIYAAIGANVVSFPYGPMPTQPLGWFKKPVTKPDDFKGMKFRTVGISIDLFTGMGAAVNALPGGEIVPALDRGLIDAAEFNNASSDRILGFADVAKVCMLQSYHQNAEQLEISFNKTKYDGLPAKMKALIEYAVEAASADMSWKAIHRYSQDYIELQTKDKVRFYKTPASVLQKQLDIFDGVLAKYSAQNPFFKEIAESQRKFAERAVKWYLDTQVDPRMAYNHYFAKKPAAKPAAPAAKPAAPAAKKG